MIPECVVNLLQVSNEYLSLLEHSYKRLTKEIESLKSETEIRDLRIQVGVLAKVSEEYREDREFKQTKNKT